MSRELIYESIRKIIGSNRTELFFNREEQLSILRYVHLIGEDTNPAVPCSEMFRGYFLDWNKQITTDTHPVVKNLEFILNALENQKEANDKHKKSSKDVIITNVFKKRPNKNAIINLINSLAETDFTKLIKEISLQDETTIIIKLKGGENG